uniref:RING-type E3 ubiquitin transferase n=1 Tax=Cajanus cajan TaxID=3821 RepID=A0A151SAG8_CAJCA|nr:E3 ubiquitin-protein ligase rnf181 family [Cajanus cajan]
MLIIKITQSDSQCPICLESFGVGCEAKKMPYDHIYHSHCIGQWLFHNNSCPVCRFRLPPHSQQLANTQNHVVGQINNGRRRNLIVSFVNFSLFLMVPIVYSFFLRK